MLKLALLVFLCAMLGCTTRLGLNEVGEMQRPNAAGALLLSPQNTRITFIGSAVANSHEGIFTRFTGQLICPTDDPQTAQISVQIAMDSVYTKIDLLTKHLKEADFFDVTKFPTATFISSRVEPAGNNQQNIVGNLTLHGITKPVIIPSHLRIDPDAINLNATITIHQSDFQMRSARITNDEVPITVVARINRR